MPLAVAGCKWMVSVKLSRDAVAVARFDRSQRAANAALLDAIRQDATAASDPELRATSFDALVQRYASTQSREVAWLDSATATDLERILSSPVIPNGECSIAQALMQVCMHSPGSR